MSTNEFIEYCIQILEVNFGQLSGGIIKRAKSRKTLDASPSLDDYKEFIEIIEQNITMLSGKEKAVDICKTLMTKAVENIEKRGIADIPLNEEIDKDINDFLAKNSLPSEDDINDYAKFLSLKYKSDAKNVKKDIIEKVKSHIKNKITFKKTSEEINNFLSRFPQPTKTDVDDFINYLRLSKMCPNENELREHIEKERLYRKFHGAEDEAEGPTEIDDFLDSLKNFNNQDEISEAMEEQKLSYLITSNSKSSDPLLSEFVDLMKPKEEDVKETLNGLGLEHMIKGKNE